MSLHLRISVPDAALLARVAGGPSPKGLRWSRPRYLLLRETWFDTSKGALAQGGLTLCLRLDPTGVQTLELAEVGPAASDGIAEDRLTFLPLEGRGLYEVLSGDSEMAERIRTLTEPAALRPRLALDIDREVRDVRQGLLGKPACAVYFDEMLAHDGEGTRRLNRILVTGPPTARADMERMALHMAQAHGLTQTRWAPVVPSVAGPERGAPVGGKGASASTLALLVVRHGSLGLVQGPGGLTVPTAPGSGEASAAALATTLAGSPASLDLVGSADAGGAEGPAEVWLATLQEERSHGALEVWVPVGELMERMGTPDLRDPVLVAAVAHLARSGAGQALLRSPARERGAPTPLPARPREEGVPPGESPTDFLDAELSILAFNQRVLEMAEDPAVPLLERLRFASIFASNMDEFFVVRLGRLKDRKDGKKGKLDTLDLPPHLLVELIAIRVRALAARQQDCLRRALLPALEGKGVRLLTWPEVDAEARSDLSERFRDEIFPLLTPQALTVSPGQPFPRLETLKWGLAAVVRRSPDGPADLAHVPVPADVPDFLPVLGGHDFIPLSEVLAAHAAALFPGTQMEGAFPFRVTRGGDVALDEEGSASLLDLVEDGVEARAYKPVVRVEVDRAMPREARANLLRGLRQERGSEAAPLGPEDVFEVDRVPALAPLIPFLEPILGGEAYPPFQPHKPLPTTPSIFQVLAEGDHLVHHPFESFDDTVGRFLAEAAHDPQVVSIRLALYRTGRTSRLAGTLLEALENGKDVSVFVELKARFDEESNILWTRRLAEAGGHVVYGVVGFKTHAKLALVVRREGEGFRRYVHVGTGNYNATTARVYTDVGLLSADPELGADVQDFFNELTGSPGPPLMSYRKLLVAPNGLPQALEAMIQREVEHARTGRPARIQAKLNGLTDRRLVQALYAASEEGVEIDLVVRSACTLRPGLPGLSQRIRVRSILGRFLEHARIYCFENGGDPAYFIASADWRRRNLRRRVEVAAPVEAPEGRARLRAILDAELRDPRAWVLHPDGSYVRLCLPGVPAQELFLAQSVELASAPP